jgi:hypothetical protein
LVFGFDGNLMEIELTKRGVVAIVVVVALAAPAVAV